MRGQFYGVSSILAAAIASTPIAHAQDENQSRSVPSDEIIVTGEKVDRSLQDTITSVGLITGDQLELDAVDSLADSFTYIANVNLNAVDEGFSIRGIPFDNLLGAGSSPLAQIYVDDVTIGDQAARFSTDNIWDVAQIEVLRGAQSTVQGRNALAGAIIIRTADPTYDWQAKARAIYLGSEYGDEYSTSLAFGGPLIEDVLAFRVAGERRESDGFVTNPVRGLDGSDFNDQWQGRVKLLFEPADRISSLFTFAYSEADVASPMIDRRSRDANGFINLDDIVPGNESNRENFANLNNFNRSTQFNYSLKTDWQATDAISLTFITAYTDSDNTAQSDLDDTFINPALFPDGPVTVNNPFNIPTAPTSLPRFDTAGAQFETQTIFTQEVTAYYDNGGRFRGLVGGYYADSREDEFNFVPGIQTGILETVEDATRPGLEAGLIAALGPFRGVAAPGNPVAGIPAGPAGDAAFDAFIAAATDLSVDAVLGNYNDLTAFIALTSEPLDVQNFAFYAKGEYDVTDAITIGFGIRYDNEEQTEGLTVSGDPLALPDPAALTLPAGFPNALTSGVVASVIGVNDFFEASLAEASTSATQRFDAFLPSGFIRYQFDDDRSLSFSVRRGYRSGGTDLNIPRQFVSQFDPEFTMNYELALRSFWFDRALRLNANVFYTDWTDQQVVVGLSTLIQDDIGFNVGSSTLRGFEADALWTVTPNLMLQGVLGYSDTQFEDFDAALAETLIEAQRQTAPIDLDETLTAFEGREFAFAPNWSGAARVVYQGDSGLFGVLGVTYEGASFVNNANSGSPTFLDNEARTLVNLTAGYTFDDRLTLAFIARNLFDVEYVSSGGDELVRLGAPREIGLRAQANF